VGKVEIGDQTLNAKIGERAVWVNFLLATVLSYGCKQSTSPEETIVPSAYVQTRASWSPDGKTIAFRDETAGKAGVYLVDTSGANVRLLVAGDGVGFSFSPDSRWLAFSSAGALKKIRVNGDSLTQLTAGPSDIRPAWSYDGAQIAFVRTGVWALAVGSLSTRQLSTSGNFPSWHPNGREVVVMVERPLQNEYQSQFSIDAVHTASGVVRTLYSFETTTSCGFGSISPDSTKYAFRVQPGQDLSQIWIVDLTTHAPMKLTNDGGDQPAWSPDGGMLVYTRTAAGDGTLWMMRSDGSGKRRLTFP
jgi:Tol biopolymer transport system component